MFIFDVLGSVIGSVLLTYLSFTNILAERIEQYLYLEVQVEEALVRTEVQSIDTSEPSVELSVLSRMYAQAGGVSQFLRSNPAFQEAGDHARQTASVGTALNDAIPLEERVMHSLVNIFCHFKTDAYTKTTTGTGFFIHENGVILTNAHVAQFLLLKEVDGAIKDASCVVRSGNPAMPRYTAELLFISPTWISHNAKLITEETPRGTGEYDYALLYVSGAFGDEVLPSPFPSLPFNTDFLPKRLTGTPVLTAGYPAEKLFREGAKAELIPRVASTTIHELYTFGSNYADIFSVTASNVGEQGASGGPIAQSGKGAIGLIVTKGDERTDGVRSLRALTLSYIDRTITDETGFSLTENTAGNLAFRGDVFKNALAPFLARLLEYELR